MAPTVGLLRSVIRKEALKNRGTKTVIASGLHYEEIEKACNSFLSKPASRNPTALLPTL